MKKIFRVKLFDDEDERVGTYDVLAVTDEVAREKALEAWKDESESEIAFCSTEFILTVDVE